MELSVSGNVIKVMPAQTGQGRNGMWTKQSFVIETKEHYPKKICLIAWNDMADIANNLRGGEEVKVDISIESREYMERWYTDVRAVKITRLQPTAQDSAAGEVQDTPMFSLLNSEEAPPPSEATTYDNDLPF